MPVLNLVPNSRSMCQSHGPRDQMHQPDFGSPCPYCTLIQCLANNVYMDPDSDFFLSVLFFVYCTLLYFVFRGKIPLISRC